MTTKQLYVSSAVQKALLAEILIPEMASGFWKDHRPADHAAQWADVEVVISDTEKLGAVGFTVPRLYNFVNPDFIKPNEARLVEIAQKIKASSNFRSVKKELIELSRIVGGRLMDKNGIPTKANRGNNKSGTVQEAVKKAKIAVKKATGTVAKKTAVKKGTTTKKGGTTVKRVPVTKAEDKSTDQQLADAVEQITDSVSQVTTDPKVIEQVAVDTLGVTTEEVQALAPSTSAEAPKSE